MDGYKRFITTVTGIIVVITTQYLPGINFDPETIYALVALIVSGVVGDSIRPMMKGG